MILLLMSLKGQIMPSSDLINCRFLQNLTELVKLTRQCVLSPKQLLEDFMAEFIKITPFLSNTDSEAERAQKVQDAMEEERSIKQSLRNDFQFGDLAFGYLNDCPFFEYLSLRTRNVVRRSNCQSGCIDPDDWKDPLKYDRNELITPNEDNLAFPVGMPNKANGESLEAKFLSNFYNPEVFEKDCYVHPGLKKKHSISTEIFKLPNAILLNLQRGFFNANNVLSKKTQAVLLDKEFTLKSFDNETATYKLHASGRHVGRKSCLQLCT